MGVALARCPLAGWEAASPFPVNPVLGDGLEDEEWDEEEWDEEDDWDDDDEWDDEDDEEWDEEEWDDEEWEEEVEELVRRPRRGRHPE